jgi:penicillin amidase
MWRIALKTAAVLALLVAILAAGGFIYLRRSLPRVSGTVRVEGISGTVDIVRDADNIPHIFATVKNDALFGLGYAHAQDRLWQMEFQRRIGHGRLSEIFGAVTIPQDRFLRTVGFGRAARAAWDRLPAGTRDQVNAYIGGINAFLAANHGSRLPPEFTALRFEPEPWTGADVIVWTKMMAWDLSANYALELLRHDVMTRVGRERMQELFPAYDAPGPNIVDQAEGEPESTSVVPRQAPPAAPIEPAPGAPAAHAFARMLREGHPAVGRFLASGSTAEAIGSNNWVVSGTLTASGKPLLANDPHLGAQIPSLWYLAHMSAGDFDVTGGTLPGTPAVAIGRNRFIAWGETNVAADVQDLYRERLDAAGAAAEYRGAFEPLRIVPEEIVVNGGDPVRLEVRITRHGPLVSDAVNANNAASANPPATPLEPLALRWTALDEDDETLVAFMQLNEARDWTGFREALRHLVAPAQNFVYADTDGHIGYYAPGRIPVRASGDGSIPPEGWSGEMEWTGWIPFEQLPHVYDPPNQFIVTANQRPLSGSDPRLISLEYPEPYRARRIIELIKEAGTGGLTPDHFRAIQADVMSLHAQTLLPILLEHVSPEGAPERQALELLKQWDYRASGDSAAAAIFQAWFLQLAPALAGDELGPELLDTYQRRFSFITRFVTRTLAAPHSRWCDDVKTPRVETCDEEVGTALKHAVAQLTAALGGDLSRWRWDAVHHAVFPHQGLDAVAVLRPILGRTISSGGDWSSVNVGAVAADRPFEQHEVAGYRQIVDLSPANDSRFLDAVGQSGHFLSRHYADFLGDWQAVRHKPMRADRASVDRGALGTLTLTPQ